MPARRSGARSAPCAFSERTNEIIGLSFIGFAVFLTMALWTFDPGDPSWGSRVHEDWPIRNYGGAVGAYAAGVLVQVLGAFSVLMPAGLIVWGVAAFAGLRSWRPGWRELVGAFLLISASGLFFKTFEADPLFGATTLAGGIVGYSVAVVLDAYLGDAGSWVLLTCVFLAAFVATTGLSVRRMVSGCAGAGLWFFARAFTGLRKSARAAVRAADAGRKPVSGAFGSFSRGRRRAGEARTGLASVGEDAQGAAQNGEGDRGRKKPGRSAAKPAGEGADRRLAVQILRIPAQASPPEARRNGGRGPRVAPQNAPSLFGEEASPKAESPVLSGPAAEFTRPENPRKKVFHAPAEDSGGAARVREEGAQLLSGAPENGDLASGAAAGNAPNGPASVDDAGCAPGLVGSPRIGGARKETRGDSDDSLSQEGDFSEARKAAGSERARRVGAPGVAPAANGGHSGEDAAPASAEAEGLMGGGSPAGDMTEDASGDMKVRHAGANGEAEVVRIEDDALVRADEQAPPTGEEGRARPARKEYALPSLEIFKDPAPGGTLVDEAAVREKSLLLEQTLQEFGVVGKVREVKTGPVITVFEYDPAPGIKVAKITGLADDLARALSALSVRIVAPIPGKSVVGIEVPNVKRDAVFAKEVFSSREFMQAENKLTLGLGKDILGRTAFTDLAKIPHLLIAGTTGSGKSVALNMMICSLLSRCTPREVRFLMVDPKMLELSIYEGIPHQLVPVVTDPKKAAAGLRGVLAEMERRYQIMSAAGVRNIQGYNDSVARRLGERAARKRWKAPLSEEHGEGDFLPYIVVVIDELADLMMVAPREVEESMTRLAQMARASGIHLLVATQRPSVDVLTGLIKANFPSRMALRVATRTDSRTILDANGAERLLGKGDMLFVPPGSSVPARIHGAYVSDNEIFQLVEHWKAQGEAVFREDWFVEEEGASSGGAPEEEEHDERYDDAIALVSRTREASISLIQRHLRIGYNRAARMIERMEQEGVIGPADGVKRRQVLVSEIPGEEAPVETP